MASGRMGARNAGGVDHGHERVAGVVIDIKSRFRTFRCRCFSDSGVAVCEDADFPMILRRSVPSVCAATR
jgi:hypothetical protein